MDELKRANRMYSQDSLFSRRVLKIPQHHAASPGSGSTRDGEAGAAIEPLAGRRAQRASPSSRSDKLSVADYLSKLDSKLSAAVHTAETSTPEFVSEGGGGLSLEGDWLFA